MSILQMTQFTRPDPDIPMKENIVKAIVKRFDNTMPVNDLAKKFKLRPCSVRALQRNEAGEFTLDALVSIAMRAGLALDIKVRPQ